MKHKFTVDRSRWVNGSNRSAGGSTGLLNREGNMCCLGHLCKSLDIPDDQMSGRGWRPYPPKEHGARFADLLRGEESSIGGVNDDTSQTRDAKEIALKRAFAVIDIEVTFEGDLP